MNRLRQRLLCRSLEDRIAPATFTVLNLNDSGADSLRDCISKANALAGADTIDFKAGLTGTITLTTGELAIGQAATINGPGSATLSVSGNLASRIFNTTTAPAGAAINITGLTLKSAATSASGGAILGQDEQITLNQCILSGNKATGGSGGAVHFSGAGTFVATQSTFTGNSANVIGGAIYNNLAGAKTILTTCTVSGNSAQSGAGIRVANTLFIEGCTFSDNKSTTLGGAGIQASGAFAAGGLIIRNSTLSGNSAAGDGGAMQLVNTFTGDLTIQNCTITNNTAGGVAFGGGGGINVSSGTGSISLESTIVSGNANAKAPDIASPNAVNMKTSAVGLNSGFTKTDQGGNLAFGTVLKLGPLANNGGTTQTHSLIPGSPALDKGTNPANFTTDQRGAGFPRFFGAGVDIGAYEASPQTFLVTNTNDTSTGSLRSALDNANSNAAPDTIAFDPTFFNVPRTITLTTGEMGISDAVTITGPGASLATINGNKASRIFNTTSAPTGAAIDISGVTLTNGEGKTNGLVGGAILAGDETLRITLCVLTNNNALGGGGAVFGNAGTSIVATQTSFVGNTNFAPLSTGGNGGALNNSATGCKTVLVACTFSGNTAGTNGGGIYVGGYLAIEGSTIAGNFTNTLPAAGGGIAAVGAFAAGGLTIRNSTISGNSASGGGGINWLTPNGEMIIQNCTITNNSAGFANGTGGGIFVASGGVLSLESTIISGNVNGTAPDISSGNTVKMKNSAVGSNSGFTMTDLGGNLPFGTDLKLAPLANNGGTTQTHSLMAGSPAVDKGSNPASFTADQRGAGFPRSFGAGVDIGAYEASPQTFLVTNTNDTSTGSLRTAIVNANNNAGSDTIVFDPAFFNVPRTITLTSGEITIDDPVTIVGAGAALTTVSGNNASRIFNTKGAAAGAAINISGLTLTAGLATLFDGGAILAVDESITLKNCVLTGNSTTFDGGAIAFDGKGTLTLLSCTVSGNTANDDGGGIYFYNEGSFSIFDSTISGNTCAGNDGGGLYFLGTASAPLLVRNSTFSGNSAKTSGGGIALLAFTGTLTLENSTLTGNSAGAKGGGICLSSGNGSISVESTIVSGNLNATAPDISSAKTVNMKNSAVGSSSGFTMTDLGGNLPFGTNLKLGPLANNGGSTQTHALLAGSPAINKGSNPANLTTDQRGAGFPRVTGTTIDIGAFETQPTTFVVTNSNDNGAGSLRQAFINANNSAGPDTITFDSAFFNVPRTIALSTGTLQNSDEITIIGPGADLCTVSGANLSRILDTQQAHGNLPVSISGLTFAFGQLFGSDDGAAIFAQDQKLTLSKCVFVSNVASRRGGAISIVIGSLTAIDCTFTNNFATNNGGAISASTSDVTLRRCTISGNTAGNNGGGAYAYNVVSLLIEDCTFSSNRANSASGGAVLNVRNGGTSSMIVRNSTISGNSAGSEGGGLAISSYVNLVVQNTTLTANTTGGVGGAIFGPAAVIASSIIFGNQANLAAPEVAATTVTIASSLIGSKSGVTTFNADTFTNANIGVNPLLGPLANNGGPTLTHAPALGSPAINNGSNPASLTNDQRGTGFPRTFNGKTDIGAFEVQSLTPTKITSVQINDGSAQRSRTTSLKITFDQPPLLPGNPADGFQLKRQSDSASVTLSALPSGNTVTLTFTGGPVDFGSLADGRYTLTALASQISNLDGDGNGTAGDDFTLVGSPANGLFRLFGDADGDGTVAASDFIQFRLAFGGINPIFDFDNDGAVAASDFIQFRLRFGGSI